MKDLAATYDETPYPAGSRASSFPPRIGALARLYGIPAASADQARVLEIGCAQGGNILPAAAQFPEARFHGLDLSARQVHDGQRAILGSGLTNIRIEQKDFFEFEPDEPFDYILAHGVFSWMPRERQPEMLERIQAALSPHGVAFISHNVLPGWHFRNATRAMLRLYARSGETTRSPQDCRAFLGWLAGAAESFDTGYYPGFLRSQQAHLERCPDAVVVHDLLEEENHALYYTQMQQLARGAGLQVWADAEAGRSHFYRLPAEARSAIEAFTADPEEQEQYADFVLKQSFRCSLLCQAGLEVPRAPLPAAFLQLHLASKLAPSSEVINLDAGNPETFSSGGHAFETDSPLEKATFLVLAQNYPASVPMTDLLSVCENALAQNGHEVTGDMVLNLCGRIVHAMNDQFITVANCPLRAGSRGGEHPRATACARWQAGQPDGPVTNLHHEGIRLSGMPRQLLNLLDGTRGVGELAASLGSSGDTVATALRDLMLCGFLLEPAAQPAEAAPTEAQPEAAGV